MIKSATLWMVRLYIIWSICLDISKEAFERWTLKAKEKWEKD